MKFILGYFPGSKSKIHPGPDLVWVCVARHGGKRYRFERVLKENGVYTNRLCVYDSKDYPDALIRDLLSLKRIVEWHGDKIIQAHGS